MPITLCKGPDVKTIIRSLPQDQIEHMIHVGAFVSLMAQRISEYDLNSELLGLKGYQHFGNAAFYHDIGKAWVPYEILTKDTGLTAGELRIVRRHPIYAKELFMMIRQGDITGVPAHNQFAHDAAVYHHEWWNGKGYPFGISQTDIPLIARITSICDAYDAITNDRVYRRARPHFYACQELESNAGTQFDPSLVKIFLDHEEEFISLKKNEDFFNRFQCLA